MTKKEILEDPNSCWNKAAVGDSCLGWADS